MWAESVRRFHERSEAEMRSRWVEYHRHLQILHQGLADEHSWLERHATTWGCHLLSFLLGYVLQKSSPPLL
jgi:hypothetical protein